MSAQSVNQLAQVTPYQSDGVFYIRGLIEYLYDNNIVNFVQEPIEINYTKYDDDYSLKSGSFNSTLKIRDIDFFKIEDISAQKI